MGNQIKIVFEEELRQKRLAELEGCKKPEYDEPRPYILDKEHKPISMNKWSELYSNFGYCIIGKTKVSGYFVSTMWTGITTSQTPFETVIFDRKGHPHREVKHSTEKEAEQFHIEMVKLYLALPWDGGHSLKDQK